VFLTNRPEDKQMFDELRGLSQAIIQNGGTLYDVIELYSTKSMRAMKKVFKDLRNRQIDMQNSELQLKQQQLDQQSEIAQSQLQQAQFQKEQEMANENYQNELDRINKKEIALIAAEAKSGPLSDVDTSGVPDVLEIEKLGAEQARTAKDYEMKMADIQSKNNQNLQKLQIEREKLKVARENQKNDLEIAKLNARNRAKKSE